MARAKSLHRAGRRAEAVEAYRAAVREKPSDPARHYLLGLCLLELGQLVDGSQSMKRAIALAPRHGPAHFALGTAASRQNDIETAERHLRAAIKCEPNLIAAYAALGTLYATHQRLDEALAVFRQAIERRQDHAGLQANYGNALYQLGRRAEAIAAWQTALRLDPKLATAHASLGLALRAQGAWDDAIRCLETAVSLEPRAGEHRYNLGLSYFHQRRYREARAALDAAEPLMPERRRVRVQKARASQAMCDWDGLDTLWPDIESEIAAAEQGGVCYLTPFFTLSLPMSQESRSIVARRNAAVIADDARLLQPLGGSAAREASAHRIRLGYLSSDYRDHAVGYLVASMFDRHDRNRFEVIGYSIGPNDGSHWRQRAGQGFDRLVDLQALGDRDAAARIGEDGIDILIDINGLTALARPEILALRPTILIATWLGTAGSTGAEFIDYALSDRIVTPPEMQPLYAEHLCLLPGCYYPYDDETRIERGVTRAEEGLPDDAVVLACFCAHYKIDRESFASWCEILNAVPRAVLWLLRESPEGEANLRAAATIAGIAPERLIFAARKPRADHLARLALADLALDTFVYGAHTTAADVLRAGVPMVTRLGPAFASRVAASILTAAGFEDLIAADIADCTKLAIDLAADDKRRAAFKARLAIAIPVAPIFDTQRLVRGMEQAYAAMWARHKAGEPPTLIDLSRLPYDRP
ncbi:MAG: tetratricopeptide repeat protein [Rhodospirillaceae bacterium]|nr:tetratricopeptide repeat protein [Rhodospirillaceae bacterium]